MSGPKNPKEGKDIDHPDDRGVARGGGREARAPPPEQLTLFEPGWADFAPHITASPPPPSPGFKKLSTPLDDC